MPWGSRTRRAAPITGITKYVSVLSGTHHVQVFAAGAGSNGKSVIDATLNLNGGKTYPVAAIGKLASIHLLSLTDRNGAPMVGMARVRLVHLAPNAPAVDVAVAKGPTVFSHVAYGSASSDSQLGVCFRQPLHRIDSAPRRSAGRPGWT